MADPTDIEIADTGARFACGPGETILDAALRAGLALPHNCRGGACGTCKAEILEGSVDHGWVMSFAITEEEKAAGKCLICVAKPRIGGRVVLRMPKAARIPRDAGPHLPQELATEIVAAHDVTPSVRRLVLALPEEAGFTFDAGMHIELAADGVQPARPYSIATTPDAQGRAPDGLLTLYVTRHDHGAASTWLHRKAAVGGHMAIRGPLGGFRLPALAPEAMVLMLAGGTGLAPMLSMLGALLEGGHPAPVRLMFSVRYAAEVFALDELTRLRRRHPSFDFDVLVTRDEHASLPSGWRRGHVAQHLAKLAPLDATTVLAAGSPGFVEACAASARVLGAQPGNLLIEAYAPRRTLAAGIA